MGPMLVYGIDFGTSNSLLSASNGKDIFEAIPLDPDAPDPRILRSILFFPDRKTVHFGRKAIDEFVANDLEGRLIRSIKKFLPVRSFNGTFVGDRLMSLEDIIAVFLTEVRKRGNAHFNADVTSVVLGRPAKFSEDPELDALAQNRLEKAARIAGFQTIEFLPEPVAAAREFKKHLTGEKLVFVADFGGGTSDFTVIRLTPQAFSQNDVLSIGGVSLAGDAIDGALMRHRISPHFGADVRYQVPFGSNVLTMPKMLMEKICAPADISVLNKRETLSFFENVKQWSLEGEDRQKMDQLFSLIHNQLGFSVFEEIERTKRGLSDSISSPFEYHYPDIDISENVKRDDFNGYCDPLFEKIVNEVDATLERAGVKPSQIDAVCLTGGTAKVHAIHTELARRFGPEKIQSHKNFQSIVDGLAERAKDVLNH
jgi:hypothetical chaperone protein